MPLPAGAPQGVAPGLWYLSQVDNLFVKQKVEILELFTNFETNNKYEIQNGAAQQVYFAAEQSGCCERQMCGRNRGFKIYVKDNAGNDVMVLERPLRCSSAWICICPVNFCCLQELTVKDGTGQLIGILRQKFHLLKGLFDVLDEQNKIVLQIQGPCLTCSCVGDVDFEVFQPGGNQKVAQISKKWTGLAKEMFTDADNFSVNFPMQMPVNHKALLLASAFLVDFMYFEDTTRSNLNL